MSLVNDMLRDLDRRKRRPSDSPASTYRSDEDGESAGRNSLRSVLLPAMGIVVGIVAGYFYFSQPEQPAANEVAGINNQSMAPGNPARAIPENDTGAAGSPDAAPAASLDNGINIAEVSNSTNGFRISISSAARFSFETVSRDSFSINLLLPDVTNIRSNNVNIGGFSMVRSADGYYLVLELNRMADFRVFEVNAASARSGMTLFIEAVYKNDNTELTRAGSATSNAGSPAESSVGSSVESSVEGSVESTEENQIPAAQVPVQAAAEVPSSAPGQQQNTAAGNSPATTASSASIRTPRELTFEQSDNQVSRNASQLIQRGQMMTAYQELLAFIGENPEAHRSRSTLATLLLAQQEYEQANVIVDQGLGIAPNYAAYKKIKARLYMMNSQSMEASQLLKNLPPALESDPEYFELLASSYQQNGDFQSAIGVYQDLLRHDNGQGRWWTGLGIAHESLGDVNDAIASFQVAVQRTELGPALRQYSENRIRYLKGASD